MLAGDLVRVHTVDREENPLYWKLLHAAGKATGLPVLYNTASTCSASRWSARRAMPCAVSIRRGIDAMVLGNFFLQK